jgi:predicted PurR-regulated permease PerM
MTIIGSDGNDPIERHREWRQAGIICFAVITLIVLWATWLIIRPFIDAIMLGAVLATITYPTYRRVRNKLNGREGLAALVMVVGITLLIILPAVILGMLLVQQANGVIADFQNGSAQRILVRIDMPSHLQWVRRFAPTFDPSSVSPQRLLLPVVREVPGWVARNGAAIVGSVAGLALTFAMVLLSAFFFFVEGEAILDEMAILSPLPAEYDHEFGEKFKSVIDATFRGHVFTALAQGIVTAIGLAIAHVPAAIFWGFVATVLSLLPMVGAAVVWVPAAIYLFISASMGDRSYFGAIFLTIWGITAISVVDNVIRTWTMKGNAHLPAIPLLVSVIGGMQAFGFIGLVIGPLVFSLLMSVIDIYKRSFGIRQSQTEIA